MNSRVEFEVPVVLIFFNRPDLLARVWRQVVKVRPSKLFLVADGPRETYISSDQELCRQARDVFRHIDWPCEILKNFSEVNLGCRERVASGLDWVFSQVDRAIILEDDCLPSQDFFNFCKILLEHYQDDERIWMISGNNFQDGRQRGDGSYYFSRYPHCWGWATWKRAWEKYEDDLATWPEFRDSGLMQTVFENPAEINYWIQILDTLMATGQPDSWAYRWAYTCWSRSGLVILPNQNLVANIGFGNAATNTKDPDKNLAKTPVKIITPIHHPKFLVRHAKADSYTSKLVFLQTTGNSISKQINGKVSKLARNFKRLLTKAGGF